MLPLTSETIGFKEWSWVCDALGAGAQSIILRKGGIAEGRGGFRWQHAHFVLFPTQFHQQAESVHWTPTAEAASDAAAAPERIIIRYAAEVERTASLTDWAKVAALAPWHIWNQEVVRDRFGYGGEAALSLAIVRVFRFADPLILTPHPSFGGCRSWLALPNGPNTARTPVLDDSEYARRRRALDEIIDN